MREAFGTWPNAVEKGRKPESLEVWLESQFDSSSLSRFVSLQIEYTKCTKARAADSWLGFSPQTVIESMFCVDSGNAT
jgi:hypothetical protein